MSKKATTKEKKNAKTTIILGKRDEKALKKAGINKGVWFGQKVTILSEEENYYQIRRPDGITCKVLKLRVKTSPPTSHAEKGERESGKGLLANQNSKNEEKNKETTNDEVVDEPKTEEVTDEAKTEETTDDAATDEKKGGLFSQIGKGK